MAHLLIVLLSALPPALAAAAFWRRARRAEARLGAGDRRHRELEVEMGELAERDPLTGLGNRRAFDRALAALQVGGEPGALILIDLDNFKQVNDRLGHQRGDEVLRTVARELRHRVRGSDLVARVGGDEFAVVLRRADTERAELVAAELRAGVREACSSLPLTMAVDASVGVAPLGSELDGAAKMVGRADAAMYRSKHARRARRRRRRFRPSHQLELGSNGQTSHPRRS